MPTKPPETLRIDRESVHLATQQLAVGRETVRVLFIPTASKDEEGYCHGIYNLFEVRLGCKVDYLRLVKEKPSSAEVMDKIDWADVIYVGGGDTRMMMKVWQENGLRLLLNHAHLRGAVMTGMSAGSICWFKGGVSDSEKYVSPNSWSPIEVQGLGFLNFFHCPHYHSVASEEWRLSFVPNWVRAETPTIALDDNCAFEVVGSTYRVLSSQPGRKAYLCYRSANGSYGEKPISEEEEFRPLHTLYV